MLKSMTGFGRGRAAFAGGCVTVEIRTVNHKFFEMTARLPNHISTFEDKIKDIVQKRVRRGKVNLNLVYEGEIAKRERIEINESLARNYYNSVTKLRRSLGIKDDISSKDLLLLPGVLNYYVQEENLTGLWSKIREALEAALDRVVSERSKEGAALYRDLTKRAGTIQRMMNAIVKRAESSAEEYRKKFAERVKELSGGQTMDAGRLEMEVAIFAKNCDISEEITRLGSHMANFKYTISHGEETGKKLDFIAQELQREVNTIGAKTGDFRISKNVIEIKGEIEKIREQVKNIE